MPKVEFLFDFGSPNAYLAWRVIPAIEARTGVRFTPVPVLLGGIFKLTGNQSPMTAFGHIRNKLQYEQLETQRFVRRHFLKEFRFNTHFPVNTLAIMRGAVAAEMDGALPNYMNVMFRAMWETSRKMDDPAEIEAVLREGGFDAETLMAAAQSAPVKQRLMANTESAVERGAFGSPTFFVGDEIYFGKDRLGEVEAEIIRVPAL